METRFCPSCGREVVRKLVAGRERPACACGFIDFGKVSIGVGGMVVDRGRVLLVRRAIDPGRGRWTFPGGYAEVDEPIHAAIEREVEEETGLEASTVHLIAVRESAEKDEKNMYLVFQLVQTGGEIRVDGIEVDDAAYFSISQIREHPRVGPATRYLAELILDGRPEGYSLHRVESADGEWLIYHSST